MKTILVSSLILCVALPPAHGAASGMPAPLAAARARYETAIANATKPIRDRYLEELEQMRVLAFTTKDADLAFAVSQEIALLGGNGSGGLEMEGIDPASVDGVKQRLINTTWVWYAAETITFLPDGTARWSKNRAGAFTWKVVRATPPVIEGKAWNGSKYRMTLDAGLRSGKVMEGTLPGRPTSQIRFK